MCLYAFAPPMHSLKKGHFYYSLSLSFNYWLYSNKLLHQNQRFFKRDDFLCPPYLKFVKEFLTTAKAVIFI